MRREILKTVIFGAADEFNKGPNTIDNDPTGCLVFLAKYLGDALEHEDLIRQKLSSIELQKKALQRQMADLSNEELKLADECAHLHGKDVICNESGDAIEYICVICGRTVCLEV